MEIRTTDDLNLTEWIVTTINHSFKYKILCICGDFLQLLNVVVQYFFIRKQYQCCTSSFGKNVSYRLVNSLNLHRTDVSDPPSGGC